MSSSKVIVDIESIDYEKKGSVDYSNDLHDLVVSYLQAESHVITNMRKKKDERPWLNEPSNAINNK